MTTEKFDDAIRRKIESINPQFDEKDVDKVHKYVTEKRSSAFRLSNSSIVFASLFILAVAGLLTWNFALKKERSQLVQSIDSLRKNLALAESHVPMIKTDTVYITQPVESKSNLPATQAHTQPKQSVNEKGVNLTAGNIYASQNKAADIALNQKEKLIGKNKSPAEMNSRSGGFVDQTAISKAGSDSKDGNTTESSSNARQPLDSKPVSAANESDVKSDIPEILSNQVTKADGNKDSSKSENSMPSGNQAAASVTATQAASDTSSPDKKKLQKSNFLNNIHYQVGAGIEIANAATGYSVNGEALLNNKWSVSIGVQLLQLGNELFDDDDDFHHKKGKDFSNVYSSDVTDTSSHSDIHIRTTLIRIPVKLNYHVALKHNFSLLFGAGTDMDVYAMERVGYNHKDNTNMVVPKNFNAMPSTLLFNNMSLSAGIQKEWRRFVFRAEPFISPQITNVEYKNDTFYFGLGVKILYAI